MSGRPNVLRPVRLETSFPEDIRAKLDILLWSETEKRVPKGAYQKFILGLVRTAIETKPKPKTICFTQVEATLLYNRLLVDIQDSPQESWDKESFFMAHDILICIQEFVES